MLLVRMCQLVRDITSAKGNAGV